MMGLAAFFCGESLLKWKAQLRRAHLPCFPFTKMLCSSRGIPFATRQLQYTIAELWQASFSGFHMHSCTTLSSFTQHRTGLPHDCEYTGQPFNLSPLGTAGGEDLAGNC